MAGCAGGGEGCRTVIGIRGPREIRLVAAVAIRRKRRVVIVRVALRASHRGMSPGQRKDRRVIETRRRPVRGCVAKSAICGEAASNVIGICRPSKVRLVTGITCRRR